MALSDSNYLAGKVSKDLTNANSRAALSKAFSSAIQVNGNVIDILSSDPIPDVVVIVKGTEVKTESNDQGAFNISIPNDKQQLELSKKGYSSLTIKATEITDGKLTVGLLPDVRLMAEKQLKITWRIQITKLMKQNLPLVHQLIKFI